MILYYITSTVRTILHILERHSMNIEQVSCLTIFTVETLMKTLAASSIDLGSKIWLLNSKFSLKILSL